MINTGSRNPPNFCPENNHSFGVPASNLAKSNSGAHSIIDHHYALYFYSNHHSINPFDVRNFIQIFDKYCWNYSQSQT